MPRRAIDALQQPWSFVPSMALFQSLVFCFVSILPGLFLKSLGADNALVGFASVFALPIAFRFLLARHPPAGSGRHGPGNADPLGGHRAADSPPDASRCLGNRAPERRGHRKLERFNEIPSREKAQEAQKNVRTRQGKPFVS